MIEAPTFFPLNENELSRLILKNIITDTLIGLAIGDATGVAATHYSPFEIINVYGRRIESILDKVHKFGVSKTKYKKER